MHYSLCVMGNPIQHSLSPFIHAEFARQFSLDVSYSKIKPELNHFMEAVFDFINNRGFGCNVTAPFKQQAFEIATTRSERAMIARAVNTFIFRDGNIIGDNTDGIGLVRDIKNNLRYSLIGKKIVIIGAGGAVRGILHPLLMEKPNVIIIANRTLDHAKKLCDDFSVYGRMRCMRFDELYCEEVDVMIDATGSNTQVALPDTLFLSQNSLFYDIKYSNTHSHIKSHALKKNAGILADGFGMLVEQAAESFYLWTGCRPNTAELICKSIATLFPESSFH